MGFIEQYKRLDNLCKDLLGSTTGVTTYIEHLERIRHLGNEEDFRKLKHYRYIRNQIVHENNCTEANMTSEEDVRWIVNFHSRILNQTDPLALRHKQSEKPEEYRRASNRQYKPYNDELRYKSRQRNTSDWLLTCTILLGLVCACIYIWTIN